MYNQLQKAIKLAKKTGDRLIVFDTLNTEDTFVVMSLEEYERLVIKKSEVKGLTEDELLDKINRDIALWKSDQEIASDINVNDVTSGIFAAPRMNPQGGNIGGNIFADKPLISVKEDFGNEKENRDGDIKNKWSIPATRKKGAEEILDEDENTQYLEEITF